MYYRGALLKRLDLPDNQCVEIIKRIDGMFQFIHRKPCDKDDTVAHPWESPPYISAETAEAAARAKFDL